MDCKQAEKLFNAYLDGELPPSLSTELGAHRLQCPKCRRALALLEVSGHIVTADREPSELPEDFTNRLLACVDERENSFWLRWRRRFYVGAPVAAAAVIVLAFAGVFDGNREQRRAGLKEVNPTILPGAQDSAVSEEGEAIEPVNEDELADWYRKASQNVKSKKQSGESLQRVLDSTAEQVLDMLEERAEEARKAPRSGASGKPASPDEGDGGAPPVDDGEE